MTPRSTPPRAIRWAWLGRGLCMVAMMLATGLAAAEPSLSISGFGTLAYSRSTYDAAYERDIDDEGSVLVDSVLGLQGDLQFDRHWSTTVQLKLGQADDEDQGLDLSAAWAFVAWRPDNDWLLRAGRMRAPLYLFSELIDVGTVYDVARLPRELYSLSYVSDHDGLAAAYNWALPGGDLTADVYAGHMAVRHRNQSIDAARLGLPEVRYMRADLRMRGLALTWRTPTLLARAGVNRTTVHLGEPLPIDFPFVPVPGVPGGGYYQVDDAIPGPGLPLRNSTSLDYLYAGFDQQLPGAWRLTAELAKLSQGGSRLLASSNAAYVAVARSTGRLTPYISYAQAKSSSASLALYRSLKQTRLPPGIPGADLVNLSMSVAADGMYVIDQSTLSVGASYPLSPQQTLKLAYERVRVGTTSRLVDSPARGDSAGVRFGVWTFRLSAQF